MNPKTEKYITKTPVICLIAGICSFLWGSAFPCIKIGYDLFDINAENTATQILFAGIRFTIAGVLAVVFGCISKRKLLLPKKDDILPICNLSLFQTILQYFFFYIGLANTSGVKASVILGANVFIAIIIAALIFRSEKITIQKTLGSIIGFSGIVLINMNGLSFNSGMKLNGEGFILMSTVAYAFSSGLMKRYSEKHDTALLSGYQFIFGGIVMTVAGLIFGGRLSVVTFPGILMLIYLAFVSAAAYSLWSMLLKYNDVSSVAVFGFMNPMFGFILSAILLNETSEASGIQAVSAIILVCIGIFIVNMKKRKRKLEDSNNI